MKRDELMSFAHDVASSPSIAKTVAAATTGAGLSAVFGWLEKGVGFAAACIGLLVSIALWRKLRLERQEAELRIQVLRERLKGYANGEKPHDDDPL